MGFMYIRKITLTNSSFTDILGPFNIKLEFDNTNFDFSHCNSDGSDIRFFDSDQTTPLGYYIENWDSVGQVGTIYLKIPSILANSTKNIYIMYGDPLLLSASDKNDVIFNNTTIAGSIIAMYKMDQTPNDETGNYNGVWSGSGASYVLSKFIYGANFNGGNAIQGSTYGIPIENSTVNAISFWIDNLDLSRSNYIFSIGKYSNGTCYNGMRIDPVGVIVSVQSVGLTPSPNINIDSSMHNIIINGNRLIIDGELKFTYTNSFNHTADTYGLYIGSNGAYDYGYLFTTYGKPTIGVIDQFRVFNRELTLDEEIALANEENDNVLFSTVNNIYYYNLNSNISFDIGSEAPVVKQLFWHNF